MTTQVRIPEQHRTKLSDELLDREVAAIMTPGCVMISEAASVADAARAMAAHGVRRMVAVSAAPVGPAPDGDGWLDRRVLRPFITTLLRDVYADLAVMEREIGDSGLDWTIIWPPRLVDSPPKGAYRSAIGANVPHGRTISRAEVADLMLAALNNPATVGQPVGIAR